MIIVLINYTTKGISYILRLSMNAFETIVYIHIYGTTSYRPIWATHLLLQRVSSPTHHDLPNVIQHVGKLYQPLSKTQRGPQSRLWDQEALTESHTRWYND